MSDQKNLIVAIALSLVILLGFQYFVEMPRMQAERQRQEQLQAQSQGQPGPAPGEAAPGAPSAPGVPGVPALPGARPAASRGEVLSQVSRIPIDSPRVAGSIALEGGRMDDLTLTDYRVTPNPASPPVTLLSPPGFANPYYAEFGWVADSRDVPLPGPKTVWRADRDRLAPGQPVTLTWDNGQGLVFERVFALDRDYVFTVTERVTNRGEASRTLYPWGLISRGGTPATAGFYILHEGLLGVFDGTLKEVDYDELQEEGTIKQPSTGGWLGITDKYWLVALIPDQKDQLETRFVHRIAEAQDRYQADFRGSGRTLAPGATVETTTNVFAGAKEVRLLDRYSETLGVPRFDLAIDFGWFYFLTKPFFYALDYLYRLLGNFGLAIIAFTVAVKLVFLPLANKSYRSMAKMRELQPKMMELRDKYGEDKMRMNQELMALYKREKVNPASGCLPILVQIPVFFALYKVLFVTIEMRHAPFYGWIRDLSAPDPTNVFNLFGLIPWTPPEFLALGLWPIIMGATMWLQQKLNPQPADPVQAKVFMFLPVFFTVLLASFPAGLVIYWAWNNLLSIAQQKFIMWRMGVK